MTALNMKCYNKEIIKCYAGRLHMVSCLVSIDFIVSTSINRPMNTEYWGRIIFVVLLHF